MKYIVVLGDGMADRKIDALSGKTCLEAANTPVLDSIAKLSEIGTCNTVPKNLKPGSDVANMSVLGFNPEEYYTGRSPLEAVAMGITLSPNDVTLRCNLVTLSDEKAYNSKSMLDYSAGEITTEEAAELMNFLKEKLDSNVIKFYPGVQYRHLAVIKSGLTGCTFTPPHDITEKPIKNYLPKGGNSSIYRGLLRESYKLLKNHPINKKRIEEGKKPANSIWLWGEGTKPFLKDFRSLRGLKGGVVSAVDLIKGIGVLAGMKIIEVNGATGNYNTDFAAKANAAADELIGGLDFVYVHVEAPDECGHHGDYEHKVYSIEQIDGIVVKTLIDRLNYAGEPFAMLVCPDHPTPCEIKTHTTDAIPYLLYTNVKDLSNGATRYTETEAEKTNEHVPDGYLLIDKLLNIK